MWQHSPNPANFSMPNFAKSLPFLVLSKTCSIRLVNAIIFRPWRADHFLRDAQVAGLSGPYLYGMIGMQENFLV
jgi:hypothetical protein